MSFQVDFTTDEYCDKCREMMTVDDPGMTIRASCQEAPHQNIWIHLRCIKKEIKKVEVWASAPKEELQP